MKPRLIRSLVLTVLLAGIMGVSPAIAESNLGAEVFGRWCAGCHIDSPLAPGTVLLRATRGAEFAVIEQRTDLTPEYVKYLVRKGRAGMPSFRRTEINAEELTAVAEYLDGTKEQAR